VIHRLWARRKGIDVVVDDARIRALADEVIRDDLPDFERLAGGFYAKAVDADIVHVMKLRPWKGARYSLDWGVSLAYVPDKVSLPLRFHRTLASARLDLWQESHSRADWHASPTGLASGLHGEAAARSALAAIWRWARPLARTWWQGASTLEGILALAEQQALAEQPGEAYRDPAPLLLCVLTMARLSTADIEDKLGVLADRFDAGEIEAILVAADRAAAGS
jgi:hypothetical protein